MDINRIDGRVEDVDEALRQLRERLSPQGDIVSEAGRQRTIDVFGKPLSPQQVVNQICGDIRDRGMEALLEYSQKLDGASLTPETLHVPLEELSAAHGDADADFLATIRRIRDNIVEFQLDSYNTRRGGGYMSINTLTPALH